MRKINFGKEGEVMLILNVFWTTPFLVWYERIATNVLRLGVRVGLLALPLKRSL